jgi:hypothetical protein
MFPNMRLFLGALLASIVVLCCGFGVFAAFRVNHEPLSRLPADTVALQLVASEAAGPPPAWHAPVSSRFEARERASDVRIGGIMTAAPVLLPISRVTIQPTSLRTVSAVGPEAAIDGSQEGVPLRHESSPLGLSAAAALSAPTLSTALIADANPQPAPSAQIAAGSAPAASPASTGAVPGQQASAAETQPAQPAPDAKPDTISQTGEPTTIPASTQTVAAVEPPSSNSPSSASEPAETASTPLEVAVPEPKARPALNSNASNAARRKEARQALLRRRLAARKRIAANNAASIFTQSSDPFFQSAPGAFQQPATGRGVSRKSANAAGAASNSFGQPSSQ